MRTVPLALLVGLTALGACGRLGFTGGAPDDDAAPTRDGAAATDADPAAPDAALADAAPAGNVNLVFLTPTTHTGALGGLAGADAICASAATSAGHGGTFGALLWTAAGDPAIRLGPSTPFVDPAGTPLAFAAADLSNGYLRAPVRRDAAGMLRHGVSVWFGSASAAQRCGEWTAATGAGAYHDSDARLGAVATSPTACAAPRHLICAQRGVEAPSVIPVPSGRRAFITEASWVPAAGGRATADALCAAEAENAGLATPSVFLAFLPDAGQAAEARFPGGGLPWFRIDSARLTTTAADLVGATPTPYLDGFVGGRADGTVASPIADLLWMGTTAAHCAGWTSLVGNTTGGTSTTTDRATLTGGAIPLLPCDTADVRLLCLEP